jgi:hypothetical protein
MFRSDYILFGNKMNFNAEFQTSMRVYLDEDDIN